MRKFFLIPLLAFAAMLLLAPSFINDAVADSGIVIKPNGAKKFAVMPAGATNPEGITITSNGDVVVGTFGAAVSLVRFDSVGNLISHGHDTWWAAAGHRLQSGRRQNLSL